jgi:hypothetical protein
MSEFTVTDFSEPQQNCQPQDLLARLYREIGISAVAAALDVMTKPALESQENPEEPRLPAILRDNIAA